MAWRLGYRYATLVLVVVAATPLLLFFGSFLVGILIRPQLTRYKKVEWLIYHNRYSPAIWAVSFAVGNVTAFYLGYYKEFLDQYVVLGAIKRTMIRKIEHFLFILPSTTCFPRRFEQASSTCRPCLPDQFKGKLNLAGRRLRRGEEPSALNRLPILIENSKVVGWRGKIRAIEYIEKLSSELRVEVF